MRHFCTIGTMLMIAVLAACNPSVVEPIERPCRELAAIDSLLWTQPDSALTRLFLCYDTVSDRHYANLLLSELLYKNDYEQTNRSELLEAVAYYDSVFDPFLAARAHYINGVGYYERDSVVLACKEYLKAAETMEEHFTEKELVGKKAKFMALSLTRLYSLYSNQYLHEQALFFGKASLVFYQKYNASPRHLALMLDEIGSHYDMMNNCDSAAYYYEKSMSVLPDTNSLTYRDVATRQAFLVYKKEKDPGRSLDQLQKLLGQAESPEERLSRYSIIGAIFYHEKLYDSALVYLNMVFQESQRIDAKKQAAEWLVEIYKHQGESPELFAEFLVPFANKEENKSAVKSQLSELYNNHKQRMTGYQHQHKLIRQARKTLMVIIVLFLVLLCFFVLYRTNKKKKLRLEAQIQEEQYAHEIKQKALSRRLKRSNEALQIHKKRASDLAKEAEHKRKQAVWSSLDDFIKEDICQIILALLANKIIKREAKRGDYPELQLNDTQLQALSLAAEKHFSGFEKTLTDLYPKISRNGINQCLLYLLNLEDVQIAALLSCDYTTIKRRSLKMKEAFNTEKGPRQFVRELVLR